jgi:hypothetical protein
MIKATVQKTTYLIYDTKTENSIGLTVTEDKIHITNEYNEDEFVFLAGNTQEVRKRWRNVAKLIEKAIIMVERNQKQPKDYI